MSNYIPFYATFFKEYDSLITASGQHHNQNWQFFTNTAKYSESRQAECQHPQGDENTGARRREAADEVQGNGQTTNCRDENEFIMNHFICIFLYNPIEKTFHY